MHIDNSGSLGNYNFLFWNLLCL